MINFDDKKTLIVSLAISLIVLFSGLVHMLGQWNYYEEGHGILAIVFAIACFALFFSLRFADITKIISAVILLGLVIFYANQKFEWRKSYIDDSNNGKPFILSPYITTYPTLEERHFGSLLGVPSWVQFAEECIEPSLKGNKAARDCKSSSSINDTYGIDALKLVNTHFTRMKRTAQKIEGGQMKSKRQYQRCLVNKTCAIIPLLPAHVEAEDIDRQSQDHIATRTMFWSLVNDPKISPEICEFMDLCRALRDLDVMPIEKPKAL
ncbi:MAG: hypothetical protein COB76_01980 [Alphaproteobacteria bacterium]|nr:MAG: hypothetical protein COB76_01980 [Alphaproteobacteria bacterium]